jgi:hypothetical protein
VPAAAVTLRFLTPVRMKRRGHFVGPREFVVGDLLDTLQARLSALTTLYSGAAADAAWSSSTRAVADVRLGLSQLSWTDWTRYSSRQRTTMQMGGLLGTVVLNGSGLAAWWPALWLGQWIHVGKATSFGLGKYRIISSGEQG